MAKFKPQVQQISEENTLKAPIKKTRLSQSDVPSYSFEQALRIPRAIAENYAYKPVRPLDVAAALNMTLTSGSFRGLSGASMAYGLTMGAANAPEISITPLGMRIVRPLEEGDDLSAKREAILLPRVFSEFLTKYDNAQLPKNDIAQNVLFNIGVPKEKTATVLQLLLETAETVGFIRQIKDKRYIDLSNASSTLKDENQRVNFQN